MAFLPTNTSLARALAEHNFTEPTAVQTAVLQPDALERDLLVSAQTGSGKTVAYGLAIATTLLGDAEAFGRAGAPVALIVAPTRELALQVQRELTWLYQYAGARVVSCVGGMDPREERHLLKGGVHIVVGTPGRLRDHLERGSLEVSHIKALVLDEADEMLDLGFREDLEFILQTMPEERRTLLFSATIPKTIVSLAKNYQRNAFRIQTAGEESGHADIEYRALRIAARDIEHAVVNILRFIDPPAALIFCNTRDMVRHLHATLLERGFGVVALSGELNQSERNHALQALRDGRARVCVATDVAARGIDLPQLGLVIHAELPNDAEVLQHRSGRTGRAGRKGVSILLVPPAARRRATQLLSWANISAVWGQAPSREQILERDLERFVETIIPSEPAGEDDRAFANALAGKHSAEDMAIALARHYRAQLPAAEELGDPGKAADAPKAHRALRGKREFDQPRDVPERPFKRTESPGESRHRTPMNAIWFRLDIGRQKNADPKWLVPLICRKGKITKKEIGAIRIFDDETRFEIDETAAERFAQAVRSAPPGDGQIDPSSSPNDRATTDSPPHKPPRKSYGKSDWKPRHVPASDHATKPAGKPGHDEKPAFTGKKKFGDKFKKGKAGKKGPDHKA